MRALVVTLVYRQYGQAIVSWAEAFRQYLKTNPTAQLDHLKMYGKPDLNSEDGHDIVTAKYQQAQAIFLTGEWDTFIAIEDDMVIPADTFSRLQTLLENGADIGYGLYALRHGTPRWNAYLELNEIHGRSLSKERNAAKALWGGVMDVEGVGLGCTAIKRHVLETAPFRRGGYACNDWYLALDAKAHGFVQRCDLGLVCGHMTLEPSPRIYYPDASDETLCRTEFLG